MNDNKTQPQDPSQVVVDSENVEARSMGASVSGAVDLTDIQPSFESTAPKGPARERGQQDRDDAQVDRLMSAPLEDDSIIGSGQPADPTTPRENKQTLTDVP